MPPDARTPNQILAERLTFIAGAALVLFLAGWAIWFYPFDDLVDRSGTPLGGDYPVFYIPGRMVWEGEIDSLYDPVAHQRRLHEMFPTIPQGDWLPFRYPPFVAVAMAPLAALPYGASYAVFLALSLGLSLLAWRLLAADLSWLRGEWRRPAFFAWIGCPIALETLIGGQGSMLAVAIAVAALTLLRRERYVLAGAVLSFGLYKPNVLAFFALGCLIRYPRIWRGGLSVALALAAISWVAVGWEGIEGYFNLGARLAVESWDVETTAAKVHGLGPWLRLIVPAAERPVLLALGLAATIAVAWRWRRGGADPAIGCLAAAALLSINALFNPYVPIYDLTLLAVGAALTVEGLALRYGESVGDQLRVAQMLLAILFFGPHLSQALASLGGLQPFPLVLAAIAVWQGFGLNRESAMVPQSLVPSPSSLPAPIPPPPAAV